MKSDIEIAQSANILHIKEVASKLQISSDLLEYYGKHKAKLPLQLINQERFASSKLILVTAMTPTPAGEGKTTMTIGLHDGLCAIGKKSIAVLREPSLGPVFGMKGGAAGGGYAQVIPMEDINLHFTGDFSAIEKANNLLSAMIDQNLQSAKRSLQIDPRTITWKRVMDVNDRALRQIVVGLGGKAHGMPRQDGFNITPASEIMAILCLSKSIADLKERLGRIYIGNTYEGKPIFARDLNAVGAMAVLLKDAIKPNLVQTLEGNPALIHGGPFASIAQGTNSILATYMGGSLADYVVTEAGFAADLGAEKFFSIKCRAANIQPAAVVLVVTVRALRHHGGVALDAINEPNMQAVQRGLENVGKHIENMLQFGFKPILSINAFPNDTEEEYQIIRDLASTYHTQAIVAKGFAQGGKGMTDLAQAVVEHIDSHQERIQAIYDLDDTLETKIYNVATKIYGADDVHYSALARTQMKRLETLGFGKMPVCMAKTPKSISDDPNVLGRPRHFSVKVREFEVAAGAGFVIPILGDVMRMPGLPNIPNAERMDLTDDGKVIGLS